LSNEALLSAEHLELLYRTTLEFSATLDMEELLPRVFDRVVEFLDAEAGSIWLREGDHVTCHIAKGPVAHKIQGLELPLGAGIVGDIAVSGESELVSDARDDARFVHQVDEATGFATRSMAAAALKAKNEILGVLQILNKRGGSGLFDQQDLVLLEGLASAAGLALHNAQLHAAEKRARDLHAMLEISREITATLDIDRLALSVVNLGSQAIPYDRAAIALSESGRLVLHALSGTDTLDTRSDQNRDLERLIAYLAELGDSIYVSDLQADAEPARTIRAGFADYLQDSGIHALCMIPLADEEGRLGALYMESATAEFLGQNAREAAELLANQTSVAIRNAELYGQVPLIGFLEPVAALKRRLAAMPRRRLLSRVVLPAALLVGFLSFPWAERIGPRDTRLLPADRMPVRATVDGLLAEVLVDEGDRVNQGQVIASLRDDDIRMQLTRTRAELIAADRSAAAARARGDEAEARLAEISAKELSQMVSLLEQQLGRTRLRAPVDGVVLTLRPYEKLGEWLDAGETFVVLGRTDRLEIEAWVAERDIQRVRIDQDVRLKVMAQPGHTFVGQVTAIAAQADSAIDGEPTVPVRAEVENSAGLLRPGLDARAKIVGARLPVGYLLLRPLVRWTRMNIWR